MNKRYNKDIYKIERSFGTKQLNSIILEKLTSQKSNRTIEPPTR